MALTMLSRPSVAVRPGQRASIAARPAMRVVVRASKPLKDSLPEFNAEELKETATKYATDATAALKVGTPPPPGCRIMRMLAYRPPAP